VDNACLAFHYMRAEEKIWHFSGPHCYCVEAEKKENAHFLILRMRGREITRDSNLELAEFKSEPIYSHPDKQNERL